MATATRKRSMVTIENGLILTMLADARFTSAFPCLAALAKKQRKTVRGCRRCNRSMRNNTNDFDTARQCLGQQTGTGRNRLKALLNTKKIRVRFRKANGRTVEFTF